MTKDQIAQRVQIIKDAIRRDAEAGDKNMLAAVDAALDLVGDALVCLNIIAARQAPVTVNTILTGEPQS